MGLGMRGANANDIMTGMDMNMGLGESMKSGPTAANANTNADGTVDGTVNTKSTIEMDADALLPVDVRDMRVR